jgi:hypothetical protein
MSATPQPELALPHPRQLEAHAQLYWQAVELTLAACTIPPGEKNADTIQAVPSLALPMMPLRGVYYQLQPTYNTLPDNQQVNYNDPVAEVALLRHDFIAGPARLRRLGLGRVGTPVAWLSHAVLFADDHTAPGLSKNSEPHPGSALRPALDVVEPAFQDVKETVTFLRRFMQARAAPDRLSRVGRQMARIKAAAAASPTTP